MLVTTMRDWLNSSLNLLYTRKVGSMKLIMWISKNKATIEWEVIVEIENRLILILLKINLK